MKRNLKDLLEHEIQDLYSAEDQLTKALPKMAKAASNPKLRKAFEDHLEETKGQKKRLEQIAKKLNFKTKGETCKAMEGLIKEGESILKMDADEEVRDAALIGAAQRVEHYEIAAYGTAAQYAKHLGNDEVVKLFEETLEQEKDANEKLNDLAIEKINQAAIS